MNSFFHSYDLRGVYPGDIGLDEARKIGRSYGTYIDAEEVLVGRDGRKHGSEVAQAFMKGVCSTGTDVVFAGVLPSPVVYFGQVENNFKSAAVVTASHNPPEYTGFKFNKAEGLAMSREGGMKQIQEIYESESFETGSGTISETELIDGYIDRVSQLVGTLDLSVLIDCGNGVTGALARELFEGLGCDVTVINETVDGRFPNHLPNPMDEEAQQAVKEAMTDEDLGIIFDGDGDRAGFVLPKQGYLSEDKVIAILSRKALDRREGEVVHDLRTSKLVSEQITKRGGSPVESRVGHTFISEEIHRREDVVFAGELSGHFYFPVYGFPWDDGLIAGVLMADEAENNLGDVVEGFSDYPVSPEINFDCPEERKEQVMTTISEEFSYHDTSTMDGVKIKFESGWALVRASSTEPKIRLRCEADTRSDLESIRSQLESKLESLLE